MSFRPLPFLLHTTAAAVMAYGYIHLPDVVANMPMADMKGGHFQFLTIQGYVSCTLSYGQDTLTVAIFSLCIAWITMVLSVGCDLIPSSSECTCYHVSRRY